MSDISLNCSCAYRWQGRAIFRSGFALLGLWLVAPPLFGGSRPAVQPVLDYVVDNPEGGYTAWLGYRNRKEVKVSLPVGRENQFNPRPKDRGQPTEFLPGRHEHVFMVDFPRGSLVWHLNGRTVTASPNRRPAVQITEPLTGTVITEPGRITLRATARDPDGRVKRVVFYQGGVIIGQDRAEPYIQKVSGLAAGDHHSLAVAFDNHDAPSLDSNNVIVKVLGSNQPPAVALAAPVDGAVYTAPSTITLMANTSDPDGAIAHVEFFQDGTRLGADSSAPYEWTWSPVAAGTYGLSATATDNQGVTSAAATVTVTIQASNALPLVANFEPAEGYTSGALAGQQGWDATGTVNIVSEPVYAGEQSVRLAAESPPAIAEREFSATAGSIVYLDFFARLVVGATPEISSILQTPEARIALVRRDSLGEIQLWAGDGAGGGQWLGTRFTTALDESGSADWQRYTIREDFGARTWDFYVNGVMLAANLAFAENAPASSSGFSVIGHALAPTGLDEFLAAYDNPLFVDTDNDGMEDEWETAHGLNPALNDRDGDADADGLSNITEYILGTEPGSADSDGDGMPDEWERRHGMNPTSNDAADDPDQDGVSNLIEFRQGRNPTKGAVADTTGAVNLRLYQPDR